MIILNVEIRLMAQHELRSLELSEQDGTIYGQTISRILDILLEKKCIFI